MTNSLDKFWSLVRKGDDCWEWLGACEASGYGRFHYQGRVQKAHRLAYETLVGPIPEGLVLDHRCHSFSECPGGDLCRHRRCVNPAHLEVVTVRVNALRGQSQGAIHSRVTHCPYGHPYDEANTRIYKGGRYCRVCRRRANGDYKRRNRLAINAQERARRKTLRAS